MKRGTIIAISILVAAFLLCPSSSLAEEKAAVGKVVAMEGKATIRRKSRSARATLLAEIYPNDTIITARGSKLKILFIDDSILALGSKSKIVIEKFLYEKKGKKREASFNLTIGKVRALLGEKHKDSLYEIKTPAAIAGVRGTHFIVVAARRLTQMLVLAGEIEVRDIAGLGRQVLRENFASRIVSGEAPSEPYTPSPGEVNRLVGDTTVTSEIPEEDLPAAPTEGVADEEGDITDSSGSVTDEGSTQQDVIDQPPASDPLPEPPCPPSH